MYTLVCTNSAYVRVLAIAMSKLLRAGYRLFLLILVAPHLIVAAAEAVPPVSLSFNFSVDEPSTYLQNLMFLDDATEPKQKGLVNLTCGLYVCNGVGRMSYFPPVPLCNNRGSRCEVASFSTNFIVVVGREQPRSHITIANNSHFIAIEFGQFDPEGGNDIIGININSVNNSHHTTILPNNLTLDGNMTAYITFRSWSPPLCFMTIPLRAPSR